MTETEQGNKGWESEVIKVGECQEIQIESCN